jgi:hypothetical protein
MGLDAICRRVLAEQRKYLVKTLLEAKAQIEARIKKQL